MNLLVSLYLLLLLLLTACVPATPPQSLSGEPLLKLSAIDGAGPFSANPDGNTIALAHDGLLLLDRDSQARQKLSSRNPMALAWSPDGQTLAALYEGADYTAELLLYAVEGRLLQELTLPVLPTLLTWSSRGDLLITGVVLKEYSFGGNLRQLLYRLESGRLVATLLSDSTVRPSLVPHLKPLLRDLQAVAFSPAGDELVYLFLHDPPEFAPYLELLYRNWQSDTARSLQKIAVQGNSLSWRVSGDAVDHLTEQGLETLPLWPGQVPVAASGGAAELRFFEGKLYRGTELLADWGVGAKLQRLADGTFLLGVDNALYLGRGLQPYKPAAYDENRWNLRLWRHQELISVEEYQQLLQEKSR